MVDANVISDLNNLTNDANVLDSSSVVEESKVLVEGLRPPEALYDLVVDYASGAVESGLKLFQLHPGVLIIIGGTAFALNFFVLPRVSFIPKQFDAWVSFIIAIALYGFIAPFLLPKLIEAMG